MTEEEKRLHRCCFSGHRPEKLDEPEEQVKAWLREQIDSAIAAGYTTFISGCAMGVDIWAGQIVLEFKADQVFEMGSSNLHLIAATPWPGFANRWSDDWKKAYNDLLKSADLVVNVCDHYHNGVFQQRNEWMVDHSNRVIAYFNGAPGGTRNTIEYAGKKKIEVITNNPYYDSTPYQKKTAADKLPYPENLINDIGLDYVFGKDEYTQLNGDQLAGLDHVLGTIRDRERDMIRLRYEEKKTLQTIGEQYNLSRERVRQIIAKGVRKLRHKTRTVYIREGLKQAELSIKVACAEEIIKQLKVQKKRYPQMTEEDVVKFAFQGMLGNGHLIKSISDAQIRLEQEMGPLEPSENEPLIEKISSQWVRLNLRAAKAKGMRPNEIAWFVYQSAKCKPFSFTRQNVYNFCVKQDGSEAMKAAAEHVLDENWLPHHSQQYRDAYHPAYRVIHKDFRKFRLEEEDKEEE